MRMFFDGTGKVSCPVCQCVHRLRYDLIPPSRLTFTRDGEGQTYHFGELRDYQCEDCDHEWLMSEPTP